VKTTSAPEAARDASLRYVLDTTPGIQRIASKAGFRYTDAAGRTVRDRATLARIQSLAIPPAYTDVWICPAANGHLQATGRDARQRKQYRYHPRWREVRDESKYGRIIEFARALPKLRKQLARDLRRPGLPLAKVVAAIVSLLEQTLIRVGNEEYARTNGSFGLSTLRDRHVRIHGGTIHFQFKGKSGIRAEIDLHDQRLARVVRRCQDLPGQELFQYLGDDGQRHTVGSADVNAYLRAVLGGEFTAKDFRTWNGTVHAAAELGACLVFQSMAEGKRNVVAAIGRVAARLNNTPAVCRNCYVHPVVIDSYLRGSLPKVISSAAKSSRGLRSEERVVLRILAAERDRK